MTNSIGGLELETAPFGSSSTAVANEEFVAGAVADFANIKVFGAVGDGIADDTDAFHDAAASGKPIFLAAGTYNLNEQITLAAGTNLIGRGAGLTFLDFSGAAGTITDACLFAAGSNSNLPNLSGTHALGTKTITFASAHGLAVGDVFTITVQTNGSYHPSGNNYRRGEWVEVRKVTSTTVVEAVGGLNDSYTAAEATNTKILPCQTVLRDFTLIGQASTLAPGIRLNLALRARLTNVISTNSRTTAFQFEGHYGTRVTNCTALKYTDDAGDGLSIGFQTSGSQDLILMGCEGYGDRHGCWIGGASSDPVKLVNRFVYAIGCKFDSTLNFSGIMHPISEDCAFKDCTLLNAVMISGDRNAVTGCTISAVAGNKLVELSACKGPNHLFQNLLLKPKGIPPSTYAYMDLGGTGTGFDVNCVRNGRVLIRNIRVEYPRGEVTVGATQAGGSTTTIKLASGASSVDDFYTGLPIRITKGTNAGMAAWISDYVGSTRVATISATAPAAFNDTTTNYEIGGETLAGQFLLQMLQFGSPAQIDVEIDGFSTNHWAPNQTASAIKIFQNNSKQWGTVRLDNVDVSGEVILGDMLQLDIGKMRVAGSEYGYGVSISNQFGDVDIANLAIEWVKGRPFISNGPASRYNIAHCFIDQCASDNSECFRIDSGEYVYAKVVVKRNRGSGRDVDIGLAAGNTIGEACINGSYVTSGFSAGTPYYSTGAGGKKVTWGTAAPSVGTWAVGDRTLKTDVAAAGSPGWCCTTAGTPGTWKAEANVAA